MNHPSPIAIVGMAGIFPGAPDTDRFWHNIVNRFEAVAEVPPNRWIASAENVHRSRPLADHAISRRACLIDDDLLAAVDASLGGLALDHDHLLALDPLYRMVLATGRRALDACRSGGLERDRIGVVLAAIALPTDAASRLSWNILGLDFKRRLFKEPPAARLPMGRKEAMAARVTGLPGALLAKSLDILGGSFTLDAACASSLYAVKLACDQLQAGKTDLMLAGGASRPDCLYTQIGFSQLRALSKSGRCAPFDKSADGLVVGEGVGMVALKRLADALHAGDEIHAVIRGVGLSNDMDGNLLAPDPEGQLRAMLKAYEAAGWSPGDVDLIECHGAGTPAGDLAEIRSLRRLWGESGWAAGQCPIGSVKSMIGHLLTGAGAAGLIKTLLAMQHQILPPSLNFSEPPEKSRLTNSPFRVQTEAEDWTPRKGALARRAAVSAFGFGGINAHMLLEEWPAGAPATMAVEAPMPAPKETPVAVVGMAAAFGPLKNIDDFQSAVFGGRGACIQRPPTRFRGADETADSILGGRAAWGGFMEGVDFDASKFHIPPNEVLDILPQHLLMLEVAHNAMADAGLPLREARPGMGAVIGMGFDYEATQFHLRWRLFREAGVWAKDLGWALDPDDFAKWLKALQSAWGPPLTPSRTLGALGGIIANRIGREFRFGGPTFVVSDEAASGMRALEIGVRALQQGEADAFLVGAVDMAADVRAVIIADAHSAFSRRKESRPFAPDADGSLPGDGAGAMVLKRLEDARREGDRIYAVIRGIAAAGPGDCRESTYARTLSLACNEAATPLDRLGYIEAHASGIPEEDKAEIEALTRCLTNPHSVDNMSCAIGATKPIIGHSGAAAGMASLIKTALCLYHGKIPPLAQAQDRIGGAALTFPYESMAWPVTDNGQRKPAAVAAMTPEGNCVHVVLAAGDKGPTGKRQQSLPFPAPAGAPDAEIFSQMPPAIYRVAGGEAPCPPLPTEKPCEKSAAEAPVLHRMQPAASPPTAPPAAPASKPIRPPHPYTELIRAIRRNAAATVEAHQKFLSLSEELISDMAHALTHRTHLLTALQKKANAYPARPAAPTDSAVPGQTPALAFSRDLCMQFAVGSVAKVFGPAFAEIDGYPARVRLPDDPLMLVDRILSVDGTKGELGPGRLVTEHDVLPGAWYLDGGRAPVCISVEAGQADLFLCAYLGIDFKVKGERTYRLLDATVHFHQGLPRPGDVIRYDIQIDRFVRQGDTWLFFFRFEGTIHGVPMISMTDGCAGFFTPEEVEKSGGILMTAQETHPVPGRRSSDWQDPIPMTRESYDEAALDSLRRGDAAGCFGTPFAGVRLPAPLRLPGDRLKLIDRVLSLDPAGGRYGLGSIRAEADIHPDDWFLTCHFVDDKVMPGTLMYECCAHTLRVFLLRMGWVTDRETVAYEPVIGVKSVLKCRGPVTPATRRVVYEVQIKEIGYGPEPYALADAHMFADGHRIVFFRDMSVKITGLGQQDIQQFWRRRQTASHDSIPAAPATERPVGRVPLFDRRDLIEFAIGSPSKAFGPAYQPFDRKRFIARLPGPPFLLISRIVSSQAPPWILRPGGWIEAEVDLAPDDWYFRADRSGSLPFSVLLEIALQPCGWLAAYAGSALRSRQDLKFRNLGGTAVLKREILAQKKTLSVRARMTQASEAADMILEAFEFRVADGGEAIYEGTTHFGFFTPQALEQQVGIRDAVGTAYRPDRTESAPGRFHTFLNEPPLFPDDPAPGAASGGLQIPAKALRMIDAIEHYLPEGGPAGLGFVRGSKTVDPQEWFFKAHFHQDPVCPGSLGIESFIQLIKFAARQQWPDRVDRHRYALSCGTAHTWLYRGQIVPGNRVVTVEALITRKEEFPEPFLQADGILKVDGRTIYKMENFGLRLVAINGSD